MTWPDGNWYIGWWKDGQMHGVGRLIDHNGHCYTGCFTNHMRNGNGSQTYSEGEQYSGEFV